MCCVCAGSCNHVGNHSYCEAHGGSGTWRTSWTSSSYGFVEPALTKSYLLQLLASDEDFRKKVKALLDV